MGSVHPLSFLLSVLLVVSLALNAKNAFQIEATKNNFLDKKQREERAFSYLCKAYGQCLGISFAVLPIAILLNAVLPNRFLIRFLDPDNSLTNSIKRFEPGFPVSDYFAVATIVITGSTVLSVFFNGKLAKVLLVDARLFLPNVSIVMIIGLFFAIVVYVLVLASGVDMQTDQIVSQAVNYYLHFKAAIYIEMPIYCSILAWSISSIGVLGSLVPRFKLNR